MYFQKSHSSSVSNARYTPVLKITNYGKGSTRNQWLKIQLLNELRSRNWIEAALVIAKILRIHLEDNNNSLAKDIIMIQEDVTSGELSVIAERYQVPEKWDLDIPGKIQKILYEEPSNILDLLMEEVFAENTSLLKKLQIVRPDLYNRYVNGSMHPSRVVLKLEECNYVECTDLYHQFRKALMNKYYKLIGVKLRSKIDNDPWFKRLFKPSIEEIMKRK